MLHLCWDALRLKKNYRFTHCFGDEDGMMHLKRHLRAFITTPGWLLFELSFQHLKLRSLKEGAPPPQVQVDPVYHEIEAHQHEKQSGCVAWRDFWR